MTSSDGLGLSRSGDRIARFVSWMRVSWVWYDNHLPLVPQLARFELPSPPRQRSIAAVHEAERHE